MRKGYFIIILMIFTLISTSVFGQKEYVEIANENYNLRKYTEAVDYYKLALEEKKVTDSIYIIQQLARSYQKLFDYNNAIYYYKELTTFKDKNETQDLYNYGQVLRNEERYEEARVIFNEYSKRKGAIADSLYYDALLDYSIDQKIETSVAKIKRTNIETGNRNLGLSFTSTGLIISVPESNKYEDRTTYYNLAKVDTISSTIFGESSEFSKSLNGPYYEGTPFLYDKGTKILFSSNSADLKKYKPKKLKEIEISEDGRNILKIYSSQLVDNKWSDPLEFSFNSNNYNCTFPNLNEDGTILYFSSDREGGYGGYDLWKVNKVNDSTWSSPENLGPSINTFEDEIYPFSRGSKFYFSSKGHFGIGGYDIFVSDYSEGIYSKPINVGKPLNSSKDDFSFILNKSEGYFSSNREGKETQGFDLIYYFNDYNNFDEINGIVINDESGEPIDSVKVNLFKKDTNGVWKLEKELLTLDAGEYQVEVNPDDEYKLEFNHPYFAPVEKVLGKNDRAQIMEDLKSIRMKPISAEIKGVVIDDQTGKSISGVKVILTEITDTGDSIEVNSSITIEDGKWRFDIDPKKKYNVTFSHPDANLESKNYVIDSYTGDNYDERENQVKSLEEIKFNDNSTRLVRDKITEKVLPGIDIIVYKKVGDEWVEVNRTRTNEEGEWSLDDMDPLAEYKVEFQKIGFDDMDFEIPDMSEPERRYDALKLLDEIYMNSSIEKDNIINIDNIYFNFSHSHPKVESYPILNNIVDFMNKNPTTKVELSAHTDAVGKDDFNMDLSEKRAARCTDYLVRKGINRERIISKGYGETKILNGCIEWDQCSEEKNQINRRIEIKML